MATHTTTTTTRKRKSKSTFIPVLPTELKVSIHSLGNRYYNLHKTKVSFTLPIGYLQSKLLNTNLSSLLRIEVQDVKENKDKIILTKFANDRFVVSTDNDCYYEEYATLAEAIHTVVEWAKTNIILNILLNN